MRRTLFTLIAIVLMAAACGGSSDLGADVAGNSAGDGRTSTDGDSGGSGSDDSSGGSTNSADSEQAQQGPDLVLRHDDGDSNDLPLTVIEGAAQHAEFVELARSLSAEADLSIIEELDIETSYLVVGGYSCGDGGRVLRFTINQVISPLLNQVDCAVPDAHLSVFVLNKAAQPLPLEFIDNEITPVLVATIEAWSET